MYTRSHSSLSSLVALTFPVVVFPLDPILLPHGDHSGESHAIEKAEHGLHIASLCILGVFCLEVRSYLSFSLWPF
jgi:hypothetical protein